MKMRRRVTECDAKSYIKYLRRYDVVTARRITPGGFVVAGRNTRHSRVRPSRSARSTGPPE